MRPDTTAARIASTHKRRLLPLVFGGLLIGGFAAGFLWWQHYKTTPAYSLALLVDASQRNDAAAFDRIVDMDKVVENFGPQLAQKGAGGFVFDLATSLRTQLETVAPGVMVSVKQIVREEFRKQISEIAGPSGARPFVLTAVAIPFKANISESHDKAKAKMNKGDQQVELFMERSEGGSWKVVSLRDDALAARIFNEIVKGLPRSGSKLDQKMRRQLRDLPGTLPKLPLLSDK